MCCAVYKTLAFSHTQREECGLCDSVRLLDGCRLQSMVHLEMCERCACRTATLMSKFLREAHPGLAGALIDERDQHMVERLRKVEGKGVAVVGQAHLDGIVAKWEEQS